MDDRTAEILKRFDESWIQTEAFYDRNDFEVTMRDGEKLYRQYRVNQLKDAQVSKLLQTLKSVLID